MGTLNIEETHKRLTERIEEYIKIIKSEYGSYMPEDVLNRLNSITDYSQILRIYDYGEVSAYADSENVHMPLCADKILERASKLPFYGINKEHKPYNSENMVINDNTFMTYLRHVFINGTNTEGYYEDLLLHEVMHFCGSGGGTVLDEGTNELLTRMLAQKYNLRTNSCGYPKEVKLANELMKSFGEETIIKLAFMKDFDKKIEYLQNTLGEDAKNMYIQVSLEAEKEFYEKYYSHMNEFSGAVGIAKKILLYNKINVKIVKSETSLITYDDYNNGLEQSSSKHI